MSPDGVATLSRPLAEHRAAGPQPATTLRFRPFSRPVRGDGAPNPAFEATMAGWREYVTGVAGLARETLGPGGFDLEVWNELSFGRTSSTSTTTTTRSWTRAPATPSR